jgi:hypothetical protein
MPWYHISFIVVVGRVYTFAQIIYLSLLPMWSLSLSFPVSREIFLPLFSSPSVGEAGSAALLGSE